MSGSMRGEVENAALTTTVSSIRLPPLRLLYAAASAMARNAGESPAGRIGRFTTDSPMPVPPRGREGKAVGVLNRQAVMKMNHIR